MAYLIRLHAILAALLSTTFIPHTVGQPGNPPNPDDCGEWSTGTLAANISGSSSCLFLLFRFDARSDAGVLDPFTLNGSDGLSYNGLGTSPLEVEYQVRFSVSLKVTPFPQVTAYTGLREFDNPRYQSGL
jgi:hypothetical protein